MSKFSNVTKLFLNEGIHDFHDAIQYVNALPYRRNTDRRDYLLVLKEHCGTCSTKHALLKALALEQNIEIDLVLGIFLMDKSYAPALSNVLKEYGISAIPEAHCFLQLGKQKIDITFPGKTSVPDNMDFLLQESIQPNQIGEHKFQFHQNFIKKWLRQEESSVTLNEVWDCREKCIRTLTQKLKY